MMMMIYAEIPDKGKRRGKKAVDPLALLFIELANHILV